MGREATSNGFKWGGNQGQATEAERERWEKKKRWDVKNERQWKTERKEGSEGLWEEAERERDLCMIIRSLGKTLTKNSLPTSWSPDSTPSCLFFSSPSTHPSACSPHNSLCLVFSFSLCQHHHCLITESLLSSSKMEARWERMIYREWNRERKRRREIMTGYHHVTPLLCLSPSTTGLLCMHIEYLSLSWSF